MSGDDKSLRVAVVGARRRRQGTGFYLGLACAKLGHEVVAVTTTSDDTLRETLAAFAEHDIHPQGYTDLDEALADQAVDALFIATPPDAHEAALRAALARRLHVCCEKPLLHPRKADGTERAEWDKLIEDFAAHRLHLHLNTQWPHTLQHFKELYPELELRGQGVASFAMSLCPESVGVEMIADAAPHFISMLQTLCGEGKLEQPRLDMRDDKLELRLVFAHAHGDTEASLSLKRHSGQPKPAAYAIDGCEARRRIIMPEYTLSLETPGGRRVAMRDPLAASVEDFARKATSETPSDEATRRVSEGMKHLQTLYELAHA